MPFPFSFKFSVPGIPNPFLASNPTQPASGHPISANGMNFQGGHSQDRVPGPSRPRPPSPCLSPPQPLSRKRGWVPSNSEYSLATTVPTSTSGYLDTPAKYRDMVQSSEEDEIEEMISDLPPPKRRRTLAGSIVSTALSAALIGTAVGLTVYRLWRHRGKYPEPLPPPPYEQGEWDSSMSEQTAITSTPSTNVIPPTPRSRKQRHVAGRRTVPRHRKTPSKTALAHTPPRGSSPYMRPPIPPEFNFGGLDETENQGEVEEQMDWMGDRLAKLIEEGKRALGTEIVVMSDAREDEVDDGLGAWVEEDPRPSGSLRRSKSRPSNLALPNYAPPTYSSPQTTPRKDRFDLSYSSRHGASSAMAIPVSPRRAGRGVSVDSDSHSFVGSSYQEETAYLTPEVRESMERARMLYRQRHQLS